MDSWVSLIAAGMRLSPAAVIPGLVPKSMMAAVIDQLTRRSKAVMAAYSLLLLAVNVVLIWPLVCVEYSSYTGSIEGTFIGLARLMSKYPGDRDWWPFWNGGMPFELSYLPFTHWLAAGLTEVTGVTAARGYHLLAVAAFALGPVTVFWMA